MALFAHSSLCRCNSQLMVNWEVQTHFFGRIRNVIRRGHQPFMPNVRMRTMSMVRLSRVDHVRLMVSHSVRKCSIRSESALSNETNDSKKLCIFPACNCCSSLVLHMNKFVTGIQVECCRQTASSQHRGNCACSIYWSSILRSEKPTLCTCTRWPKNHPPSSYTIIY